jgi:hypothetical protein
MSTLYISGGHKPPEANSYKTKKIISGGFKPPETILCKRKKKFNLLNLFCFIFQKNLFVLYFKYLYF